MESIYCKNCGSNVLIKEPNGVYFCQYCGSRFMMTNNAHRGSAFNTHSEIGLSDDVRRLLDMCRTDPINARKYANLILDIDPGNKEALFYLR